MGYGHYWACVYNAYHTVNWLTTVTHHIVTNVIATFASLIDVTELRIKICHTSFSHYMHGQTKSNFVGQVNLLYCVQWRMHA